ncbi:MAG: hypothetical protein K9M07_02880 [Simkaniaceae bacterium]|nr:hypothetical protein [Simkaniaceae bacterium]
MRNSLRKFSFFAFPRRGASILSLFILIAIIGMGCVVSGCQKKKVDHIDFETLMGKGTPLWKYILTKEDQSQLEFFQKIYESQYKLRQAQEPEIPKTIHFIWLGPKEFPKNSIKNIRSWSTHNPEWKIKFWTDRQRSIPIPGLEMVRVSPADFNFLYDCYNDSNNYAERSDLLRYEILNREGGIYVDHDVTCYQSFEPIRSIHQFFCGLEPPHKPIATTSISVCNNLIGSIPGHPILGKSIQKVKNRWNIVKEMYPGNDQESTILRVFHRTFCPFDEAVSENILKFNFRDMVYPAAYFNRIDGSFGIFAHHEYLGEWYKTEDPSEALMRRRLIKMSRKMNQILLISGISVMINMVFAISFGVMLAKQRKKLMPSE